MDCITLASLPLVIEVEIPPPVYESWSDYMQRATKKELRERCSQIAVRANRWRLMSGVPIERITSRDVWAVLDAARGRCGTCGSLAVERRPSRPNGAPAPWEAVGRRVGSLGHVVQRVRQGSNTPDNLIWQCLWCNTWPKEANWGATTSGGFYPPDEPTFVATDPFEEISPPL